MHGLHLIADLQDCRGDTPLDDADALRALCLDAIARAGLRAVGSVFHPFGELALIVFDHLLLFLELVGAAFEQVLLFIEMAFTVECFLTRFVQLIFDA